MRVALIVLAVALLLDKVLQYLLMHCVRANFFIVSTSSDINLWLIDDWLMKMIRYVKFQVQIEAQH